MNRNLLRRALALALALTLAATPIAARGADSKSALYVGAEAPGEYTALNDEEKAAIPLINAAHPLPDGFELPQVDGRAEGAYAQSGGFSPLVNLYAQRHSFRLASSDIWLCRHVYEAAERLFSYAESQNMNGFIITSGYRSRERQKEIYDETQSGYAAQPGQSEHESGLCFDVTAYSDSGDFSSTEQYKWLIKNCWDYGFILRYPEGTSDITGIQGESWHFRYVGADAAKEILARGITLEEYLSDISLNEIPARPLDNASASVSAATMRPAQATAQVSQVTSAPAQTAAPTEEPAVKPIVTASPTETPDYASTTLAGESIAFIDPTYSVDEGRKCIYLAGGCFFGLEHMMESIDGVVSAVSGYANGETANPAYRDVVSGLSGHRECVRVEYDPSAVSLEKLLWAYFEVIDPTLTDRQGHDIGSAYQAGIYYIDSSSQAAAEDYTADLRAQYDDFAVEIEPLTCFYEAEEYYQDYLSRNPGGYNPIAGDTLERVLSELNPST